MCFKALQKMVSIHVHFANRPGVSIILGVAREHVFKACYSVITVIDRLMDDDQKCTISYFVLRDLSSGIRWIPSLYMLWETKLGVAGMYSKLAIR